jgi:hypothetical protein
VIPSSGKSTRSGLERATSGNACRTPQCSDDADVVADYPL